MRDKSMVVMINGCPAAGKSTLARYLANHLSAPYITHLEVDLIYNMIKKGWSHPSENRSKLLLDLTFKQLTQMLKIYLENSVTVVCDYVWTKKQLESIICQLPQDNLHYIYVDFPLDSLLKRDMKRPHDTQVGETHIRKLCQLPPPKGGGL